MGVRLLLPGGLGGGQSKVARFAKRDLAYADWLVSGASARLARRPPLLRAILAWQEKL
jgi:hypothetical protein